MGRFRFNPAWSGRVYRHETFAIHRHDYPGRLVTPVDAFPFAKGDWTVTHAHERTRYETGFGGWHTCVHFRANAYTGSTHAGAIVLPRVVPGKAGPGMVSIVRVVAWPRSTKPLSGLAARCALTELLVDLTAGSRQGGDQAEVPTGAKDALSVEAAPDDGNGRRAVDVLTDYLDTHFTVPVDIPEACLMAGQNRNLLSPRFRAAHGCTIKAYIIRKRLELATELVLTTREPVKSIAHACGFHDQHHLNKAFRAYHGQSPSALRRRADGG